VHQRYLQSSLSSRRDRVFHQEQCEPSVGGTFLSILLPHHQMSTDEWRAGLRTRLLLKVPCYTLPLRCPLCGKSGLSDALLHVDCCVRLRSRRHQHLRDSLSRACHLGGIQTICEGSVPNATRVDNILEETPERRVDLVACLGPQDIALDVSMLCATSISSLSKYPPCSPRLLLKLLLSDREWKKEKRYKTMCTNNGLIFLPFIVSTGGSLGLGALRFLELLTSSLEKAALYNRRFPWTAPSFNRSVRTSLSVSHTTHRMRSLLRLCLLPCPAPGSGFAARAQFESSLSSPGVDVTLRRQAMNYGLSPFDHSRAHVAEVVVV